jgi:hypothetical protein
MADIRREKGGAMIFIALFLFAIATVGITMLADLTFQKSTRRSGSGSLVQEVHRAITGDPQSGGFGYLGDIGDFPTSLLDLVRVPTGTAPAICPSWQCWNGPYLSGPSLDTGFVLDPYNSPLEYFFVGGVPASATIDRLAVISRGPDNNTSNAAANPNVSAQFTAPLPNNAGYPIAAGNADNIVHPDFYANINSLNYENAGTLAYDIVNYDTNGSVDAIVPACPTLYTVQVTSAARAASDTIFLPYSPGVTTDLNQGYYNVRVSMPVAKGSFVEEQVEIAPGTTNTRPLFGFEIDSSVMPAFTLTVTNGTAGTIQVRRFNVSLGSVNAGATVNFANVTACSQMRVNPVGSTGTTLDSWVMPMMAYTRRIATTFPTLTVNNAGATHHQVRVLVNNLLVGSVLKRKSKAFAAVPTGTTVTITDQAGATLQTAVMSAGPMTLSVP